MKLPRFQFRLRTLMIVVTLLAVPFAYVGWQARIARDRSAREKEQEIRRATVTADVAKYEYSKAKAAYDAIPGSVPLWEIQRLERAYKNAAASADKLSVEGRPTLEPASGE
jgi:hypothetical protein